MAIKDKNNVLDRLESAKHVVIEVGCGTKKCHADAIGIDALDYPDVDIVGDIYEVLAQLPSGCVDEVYSYHFVEHVESVSRLLAELARVVKVGGLVEFVAPHFSNPYFYSDPTHRSFFGLYTFSYFSSNSPLQRKVPTYQEKIWFQLDQVDFRFKSSPPFYIRHAFKRLIGSVFNSSRYMKELYEENFCYLFPCYEVCYKLRRVDVQESH